MKYCKDCKHCKYDIIDLIHVCKKSEYTYDDDDNYIKHIRRKEISPCNTCRRYDDRCGESAKQWEPSLWYRIKCRLGVRKCT